jgi:hypothetical protein
MASSEVTSALSSSVLGKEELEKLPKDVRKKYEDFLSDYMQVKALYETLKMNSGELLWS